MANIWTIILSLFSLSVMAQPFTQSELAWAASSSKLPWLYALWTNQAACTNPIIANIPTSAPTVTFTMPVTNYYLLQCGSSVAPPSPYTVGSFLTNATVLTGASHLGDSMTNSVVLLQGYVNATNGMVFTISHDDGAVMNVNGQNIINAPLFSTFSSGTYTGPSGNVSFQIFYGEAFTQPAQCIVTWGTNVIHP